MPRSALSCQAKRAQLPKALLPPKNCSRSSRRSRCPSIRLIRRWKPGWLTKFRAENNWQYEPKWDGFRCLAFRKGDEVLLQSKAGQPLGRYFPEVVEAVQELPQKQFVLDGEIVIVRDGSSVV